MVQEPEVPWLRAGQLTDTLANLQTTADSMVAKEAVDRTSSPATVSQDDGETSPCIGAHQYTPWWRLDTLSRLKLPVGLNATRASPWKNWAGPWRQAETLVLQVRVTWSPSVRGSAGASRITEESEGNIIPELRTESCSVFRWFKSRQEVKPGKKRSVKQR